MHVCQLAGGSSGSRKRSRVDDESDDDDDDISDVEEEDDGYDSNFFGDDEDKKRLAAMTEVERYGRKCSMRRGEVKYSALEMRRSEVFNWMNFFPPRNKSTSPIML